MLYIIYMKRLFILLLVIMSSCITSVDDTIYCTEVLKKGTRIMVYYSEYPNIINTDIDLKIDGYDGFYILELSKSKTVGV